MSEVSVFRWTFEPENLFRLGDDQIEYEFDGYRLVVRNGTVEAIVPDLRAIDGWPSKPSITTKVKKGIERVLDSRMIWRHTTYKLSFKGSDIPESLYDEMDHAIEGVVNVQSKPQMFSAYGAVGNNTYDGEEARKQRQVELGKLVHRYRAEDPWANFIIDRYHRAIEDPDREFVHLFDIVNAMEDKFGSRQAARKKCKVARSDLNSLTTIANDKTVRQGRHPGLNVEELRDATEDERKVVRQVARKLIFGYLQHMDEEEV